MKIACITTSVIPSSSANSIQAMKVVHALKELDQDVRLWLPEYPARRLAGAGRRVRPAHALSRGLAALSRASFKQYDFCWNAVSQARRWGADVVYTWSLQAALFALQRGRPAVMEFHDFPMGKLGPRLFRGLYPS